MTKWLIRITYMYLFIPVILFCAGWLRLEIALPMLAILLLGYWGIWSGVHPSVDSYLIRSVATGIMLGGVWVLLSGVGGYAFQNYDFHGRNAILRDLIDYDWPVVYATPERGPLRMLVYYSGYWLPAALGGKVFGWNFANGFLFLWTWLGVVLAILLLGTVLRTSAVNAALLWIGFSGLDALGTILFAREYPGLWPPVQHLEIWSGALQYSSFTTQLFWVFNQAVPAWLCVLLWLVDLKRGSVFLIWALCFFFAPLISVGLLPFLMLRWFDHVRGNGWRLFTGIRINLVLAAGAILAVSYLYFSSNTAAQDRGWQALSWMQAARFILIEAGIFWLLLAPLHRRDPAWVVAGGILILAPFIQMGGGRDFVMRASIAPLVLLMVWCGEAVLSGDTHRWIRFALLTALFIGSLTPLFEINRSIQRTFEYYILLDEDQRVQPESGPVTHLEQGGAPEAEHPGALLADDIQTLAFLDDKLSMNYVANVRKSLYYRYLAPR